MTLRGAFVTALGRGSSIPHFARGARVLLVRRRTVFDACVLVSAFAVLGIGTFVSVARSNAPHSLRAKVPSADVAVAPANAWTRQTLTPVANPEPSAERQPARCRPYHIAMTSDGQKAYVTLSGKEIAPCNEVAVIDVTARAERKRIAVGSHPYGIALHPSGRWVVVTNRYSNFLSVIDVDTDSVVSEIPALFYCDDICFSPDGSRAYVSNFWKNQVLVVDIEECPDMLTGHLHNLGFDRDVFRGKKRPEPGVAFVCETCGWRSHELKICPRCGHSVSKAVAQPGAETGPDGVYPVLRAACGTAHCHLYPSGGFYAGPDTDLAFASAAVHARPRDPKSSPILLAATSIEYGGWADAVDGRHHPGGVVFADPAHDPGYQKLYEWIRAGTEGPGIAVEEKPRDLAISSDGKTLYVANTGSLDISVVDLTSLREVRRIFTRSPVNDIQWFDGKLILATLGIGSGHPKQHNEGRESPDRNHPEAEFTLYRRPETGSAAPLPIDEQEPLGPYDDVDGTAQEKFRDITNDVVILDTAANRVAAYEASEMFTRYTSDTFEALAGDKKGDVPDELKKVVGAFPEQIARADDRIYITMSGTFQVQEWIVAGAAPAAERLVPGRVFRTGFKPTGIAAANRTLVIANQLAESVTIIDLDTAQASDVPLGQLPEPFPANDFERGEFFVQTSVYSVDQDQSCVHCHYRDTSDGKQWSVSQVMGQSREGEERTGGSREVPDIRALVQKVPFFVEGTLSIDEPLTMMMEHNPLVDFQGQTPAGDFSAILATADEEARYANSADALVQATGRKWKNPELRLADLLKRREEHFARISQTHLGQPFRFRDFQKFIGAYQRGEPRLLPNPEDQSDTLVQQGRALFESPDVGCSACHPAPAFTDKTNVYNENRSFPPLVTPAPRDEAHTLVSADRIDFFNKFVRTWDPDDKGRVEAREGHFVAPSLRGIWARPERFLHHGHGVSLREVLCTPDHLALHTLPFERADINRPGNRELGQNERNGTPDTHGVTSHLSVWDIECLVKYVRSIE